MIGYVKHMTGMFCNSHSFFNERNKISLYDKDEMEVLRWD